MRFMESNEIEEWCAEHGVVLKGDHFLEPVSDPRLTQVRVIYYANGQQSGREPGVAAACARALSPFDECLLWITLVGIWGSGEDWPTYYAARGAQEERRSLDRAPGHLFAAGELELLINFLTLVLENGWDAYVLPVRGSSPIDIRLEVSHDEWLEVQSTVPIEIGEDTEANKPESFYGFDPLPLRGGTVSNEVIDRLREEDLD